MDRSNNDIIPLLRHLEEKITNLPVKLPIISCNYVLHVHMDIPPEKQITNEELLFRVYDVIREDLYISKEAENKSLSLVHKILSPENPKSQTNTKMLYLLIQLCQQQNNNTRKKRRNIRSDMYTDDESIWFSRKANALASHIQEDMNGIDTDNPFKLQQLSTPLPIGEGCLFTTRCISKNYLPHITNEMLE